MSDKHNESTILTSAITSLSVYRNDLDFKLCFLLCINLILLPLTTTVQASTCDVPSQFPTIQDAVDDPGCTKIIIASGIYSDPVTIDRSMIISGAGGNSLIPPFTSIRSTVNIGVPPDINPVVLTISDVVVELTSGNGFLLVSKKAEIDATNIQISLNDTGVNFAPTADTSKVKLSNCEVSDNQAGIRAVQIDLNNCKVIFNNTGRGVFVRSGGNIINSVINTNIGGGVLLDGILLKISNSTIAGNGSAGSVPGNNTSDGGGIMVRVGTLNIDNSQIIGNLAGRYGGGIASSKFFASTTTIINSIIRSNFAFDSGGGLAAADRTTITNSVIEDNQAVYNPAVNINGVSYGGGIYAFGDTLTVTDTSIRNNSAITQDSNFSVHQGGGAYFAMDAGRSADLTRVTISGNFAEREGGGIYASGTGTVNLINSTLANNRANRDGGGVYANSIVNIYHGTISGNTADDDNNGDGDGGGLFGNVALTFGLIGNNIDKSNSPNYHPDCSGGVVSSGYSIIGVVNGCDLSFNSGSGNQNGTTVTPVDIKLLPLTDNGGLTQTMALGLGSPALDSGTANCASAIGIDQVSMDQRSMPRVDQDGDNNGAPNFCDIGAVETYSTGCLVEPVFLTEYTYTGPGQDDILSKTSITTSGSVIVGPMADVYFAAGNSIDIGPGFSVESGGVFLAEVTPVGCP